MLKKGNSDNYYFNWKCLFVATVATESAVFVATLPLECQ